MCTTFTLTAADHSIAVGRTMEFAPDLGSRLTVFPRKWNYRAESPVPGEPGLAWQGTYGTVGMDLFGLDCLLDGVNEAGLYFGALYLPGFAEFQTVPAGKESDSLSQVRDIGNYLLSTCATVDEARRALQQVLVWGATFPGRDEPIELHYAVHDKAGRSMVVEYIAGELRTHDNPLGVLTNSPPFDWHLLNLGNFINLSATNVPDLELSGYDVKALGQGTGLLGLPGDFTPPSRFVRAVALSRSAREPENNTQAAVLASHILDSFDITEGLVRGEEDGRESLEYTQWSTISTLDGGHCRYFVRYYENPVWHGVDLSAIDFDRTVVTRLDTGGASWFSDITPRSESAMSAS
ncbi:choloylglycine hydrolase family protein [Nocardia sp. NBC_00416]|uniref:choloylglycine hydrolase family protein n=1 Tax=Nocardia sp. NBC_00416 TaxID=2975991 RepID=UPI002E1AA0CF